MENIRQTCIYCNAVFLPHYASVGRQRQCGAPACRERMNQEQQKRAQEKAKERDAEERKTRMNGLQLLCAFCRNPIQEPKHYKIRYCSKKCAYKNFRVGLLRDKIKKIESGFYIKRDVARVEKKIKDIML